MEEVSKYIKPLLNDYLYNPYIKDVIIRAYNQGKEDNKNSIELTGEEYYSKTK